MTSQAGDFLDRLYAVDRDGHRLVNQAILVLEQNGPAKATSIANLKELRPALSRAD